MNTAMRKKQAHQRPLRAKRTNEWLLVIKLLDERMGSRASSDAPRKPTGLLDDNAADALNRAYQATLRYYTLLLENGRPDPRAQTFLSKLWQKAGTQMRRYEPAFANRLKASNRFWASAATWETDTIRQAWAHLNSIRTSTNILLERAKAVQRERAFSLS